jgi:hypothetical protein
VLILLFRRRFCNSGAIMQLFLAQTNDKRYRNSDTIGASICLQVVRLSMVVCSGHDRSTHKRVVRGRLIGPYEIRFHSPPPRLLHHQQRRQRRFRVWASERRPRHFAFAMIVVALVFFWELRKGARCKVRYKKKSAVLMVHGLARARGKKQ